LDPTAPGVQHAQIEYCSSGQAGWAGVRKPQCRGKRGTPSHCHREVVLTLIFLLQPYKKRSQAAKELREQELASYMSALTPEDIKRENSFRAAQRKAGKSRKGNIKDPNAPKKPLSAYFMFLRRIRATPQAVKEIFGDETDTTKQSVLAAAKWRSMTDDERKV
jgi:hypothetical protein